MMKCLLAVLLWLALAAPVWATVQFQTVNFIANTAGATTTFNTSFQWKAAVCVSHCKTTEGESAGGCFTVGFSDGTNERGMTSSGDDAVATTNVGRSWQTAQMLVMHSDGTPTVPTGGRVTNVAFNASTTVLTFSATPSAAWEISCWGFGGADITNTFVGHDTMPTGVGAKNVTGVGFQGDMLFLIAARSSAATEGATPYASFGAAKSSASQWGLASIVDDAATTSAEVDGVSRVRTNACLLGFTGNATLHFVADFTQWTSNGFDLNFSQVGGVAYQFAFLVIKGGQWNLGVGAKPSGTGAQNFSVGFTPRGMGFLMSSPTALDTTTSNAVETLGAWDGTTEIYAGGFHNDAINTVAKSAGGSTKVLCELNATACADGTSLASTSVITWDAAGTAYEVAWWAAGDTPSATPGITAHICTAP